MCSIYRIEFCKQPENFTKQSFSERNQLHVLCRSKIVAASSKIAKISKNGIKILKYFPQKFKNKLFVIINVLKHAVSSGDKVVQPIEQKPQIFQCLNHTLLLFPKSRRNRVFHQIRSQLLFFLFCKPTKLTLMI